MTTRSKMPKVKAHSMLAIVKGHKRSDMVFEERFVNSIRSDSEDAVANNFLSVGVEIAGYTLSCTSGKNSGFNPSFWEFGMSSAARRKARLATAACILSRWKGDLAILEAEVWTMCSSVGGRVEAGGLRVLEFKIQGFSEVVEGGGGTRR